ncbi:MAG: MFS transporter [Anaerolineae bacterium]|nr:MFS transporter [Anaerolineae bacterium]
MRRVPGYWRVAAVYALSFGATALFITHLNQFLLDAGFSGAEVGNMYAVANLGGLLVVPLLSSLADRSGRHRGVLRGALLVESAAMLVTGLAFAPLLIVLNVVVARSVLRLDVAIRDRLTLHWLSEQGSQAYGGLRLWGSLGFAALALAGGAVAEIVGARALFGVAAVLVLLVAMLARVFAPCLPARETPPKGVPRLRWPPGDLSPALLVILLVTALAALAVSATSGWSYTMIEFELGGGKSAVGLYSSLAALVEIPIMLTVDRLLRRRSAATVWVAGMLLWSAGHGLLSLAQAPWQGLVAAVVVGAGQGFTIVTPVVYVGQVSRPTNTAFNLALMGVFSALGMTIASPVMGYLYDSAGIRVVLQAGVVLMLLAAVALVAGAAFLRRQAAQPTT